MKILLIDPPFQKFMGFSKNNLPIGLLSLAASLKAKGHDVIVYDVDYNPNGLPLPFIEKIDHYSDYLTGLENQNHPIWIEIINLIKNMKPDVVGVSVISVKVPSALKVAELSKLAGVSRVIFGGVHATICPEDFYDNPYVDSVVSGEGELVFEEAMEEKKVVAKRILDLDVLPSMDRMSLYNLMAYKKNDLGVVMTARGCPYSCNFCCSSKIWGRRVIYRSVPNVISEVKEVKNNFGVDHFYFCDDTFSAKKERTLLFCDELHNIGVTWECLTRVDTIDGDMIRLMKKSGCNFLKIGLESGSQRILDLMNKNIKKDRIIYSSKILKEIGMDWMAYFIMGYPGETEKDLDETLQLIEEIKPKKISFSVYTPYPGTSSFDKLGLGKIPYQIYNHHCMIKPLSDVSFEKMKQVFLFTDHYNNL